MALPALLSLSLAGGKTFKFSLREIAQAGDVH
jgi:hypothetical protein